MSTTNSYLKCFYSSVFTFFMIVFGAFMTKNCVSQYSLKESASLGSTSSNFAVTCTLERQTRATAASCVNPNWDNRLAAQNTG